MPPSRAEVLAAHADYAGSWSKSAAPALKPGAWVYRQLVTSSGWQQVWATAGDTEQARYRHGTLQACQRTAACAASTQWLMPAGPSYALVNPVHPRGRPFRRVNGRLVRTRGYKVPPALPGTLSALLRLNSYDTGSADVAFEFPYPDGITAILLSAHTYQFAGYVRNGVETIVARQSIVSGPGVQP